MIRSIRLFITAFVAFAVLFAPAAPTFAAATDVFQGACGASGASGSTVCKDKGTTNPITGPDGLLIKATHVLAIIAGAVAVIIIVVSGLRYVLSEGDPAKAAQARNGIIYAAVGLVVIVAAQSIITFVLDRIYK